MDGTFIAKAVLAPKMGCTLLFGSLAHSVQAALLPTTRQCGRFLAAAQTSISSSVEAAIGVNLATSILNSQIGTRAASAVLDFRA